MLPRDLERIASVAEPCLLPCLGTSEKTEENFQLWVEKETKNTEVELSHLILWSSVLGCSNSRHKKWDYRLLVFTEGALEIIWDTRKKKKKLKELQNVSLPVIFKLIKPYQTGDLNIVIKNLTVPCHLHEKVIINYENTHLARRIQRIGNLEKEIHPPVFQHILIILSKLKHKVVVLLCFYRKMTLGFYK